MKHQITTPIETGLFLRYLFGRNKLGSVRFHSSKKGFFSEIIDSVKNEVSKDEELKASLMKMEARLTDAKQNPALKAVKDATKSILSQNSQLIEEISRLQKKGDEIIMKTIGRRRSKKPTSHISTDTSTASKILDAARQSVSESKILKNVEHSVKKVQSTLVDDTDSYLYGGFSHRELRRLSLSQRREHLSSIPVIEENPNAGTSITSSNSLSSLKGRMSSALSSAWDTLCEQNPVLQKAFEVRRSYEESNNVFVFLARTLTSTITSPFKSFLFKESETAQVIKEIRLIDPTFLVEKFLSEATKYLIPEILESLILLDRASLRLWCSESLYAALTTSLSPELIGEGQILDLRHVDLLTARIVNDFPVLVISFSTQQISCIKNSITGKLIRGSPDSIDSMFYVWALAKTSDVDPLTGGWRLIEMSARDARSGL